MNTSTEYFLTDALGSVRQLTDAGIDQGAESPEDGWAEHAYRTLIIARFAFS